MSTHSLLKEITAGNGELLVAPRCTQSVQYVMCGNIHSALVALNIAKENKWATPSNLVTQQLSDILIFISRLFVSLSLPRSSHRRLWLLSLFCGVATFAVKSQVDYYNNHWSSLWGLRVKLWQIKWILNGGLTQGHKNRWDTEFLRAVSHYGKMRKSTKLEFREWNLLQIWRILC